MKTLVRCTRRAVVAGIWGSFILLVPHFAHATPAPNFVECSLTPQGTLSCASFNGGSCGSGTYAKYCIGQGGAATCSQNTNGTVNCAPGGGAACYMENGTAKCYWTPPAGLISTQSPTALPATTVNSTSSSRGVPFNTGNTYANYTIYGFTVTGDFQIAGASGACTQGSTLSSCLVYVTATPHLPGTRYGTLSMITSVGTVAASLTVNGTGLVVPAVDGKNAGSTKTLRAIPPNPVAVAHVARGITDYGTLFRTLAQSHSAGVGHRNVTPARHYGVSDYGTLFRSLAQGQLTVPVTPNLSRKDDTGSGDPGSEDCSTTPTDPCPDGSCEDPCADGGCEDPCPDDICDAGNFFVGGWEDLTGGLRYYDHPTGKNDIDQPEIDIASNDVAFVADPVNTAVGNKFHAQTDFSANYPNPLSFSRTYNSFGFASAGLVGQNIGIGWRSNWDRSIVLDPDGYKATVVRDDGKSYLFTLSSGIWTGSAEVAASLSQIKDGSGYAIGWTLTLANGDVEKYDALGRLTTVIPFGGPAASYTLTYDGSGRLQTVSNGIGHQLTLTYDVNNRLATLTDSAGGVTTYSYDTSGRLTGVTYADSRTRQYAYESTTWPFAMTAIIDGTGTRFVTFTYDSQGRMSSSQFAGSVGGGTISYGENSASYTDAVGTVWQKAFAVNEGESQLTSDSASCTNCPTQASQLTYDSIGQLSNFTNKNGVKTTYTYNSRGLPTQVVEAASLPEQRTTAIAWHATLPLRTQVTNADNVITYQYDSSGRKTQATVTAGAASRTTQYTYNGQGLLSQVTDPRNNVTAYTYDSLGNVATITNARGQIITYSQYNGLGQAQSVAYPNGTSRTFTYDALGRVLTETYAGNTTTYTYDANGNKASAATSDGNSTTYVYDSAERLTRTNNNLGEKIQYTLDATNNSKPQVTRTDTYDSTGLLVSTSSTVYDGMGRVTQTIDSQGHLTKYSYDANGNLSKTTDPLNNVVQMNYDGLNRPVLITDPLQHTIQKKYDSADRVTQLTDPNGNPTQYTYSGFGDNTQLTSPDTGVTSYTFDNASNRLTSLDARGKTTTYSYDTLSRLTQVTFADGEGVSKTYDVAPNGVGQLSSMTDPAGTTSFTYDANGMVLTKTQISQGVTLQVAYGRDSLERITSITYPSGKTLALTYTTGRVTSMTWNGTTVVSGVQYFPFGPPESWLFGGTTEYTRYIDENNRIWKYLTPPGSRSLSYDLAGRITQVTDAPSALVQNFTYDVKGRLLTFSGYTSASTSESRSYTYDANGNRLTATVNGVSSTYSYTTGTNKLQNVTGLYTNTYDSAGNLLSDGRLTHTYDARGRLVQTVVPGTGGTTLTFQYNGKGERATKWDTLANIGHMWIYDDAGQVLGEYTYPGGTPVQELIWLGSTPVAVAGAMPVSYGIGYLWTDHLGTPRAITNANGQQLWQWDSAPFGDTLANGNPSGLGVFVFNERFPGQYFDAASGLLQNGARVYDPNIGRYIESDPIGLQGGLNSFAYAGDNPLSRSDAAGLDDNVNVCLADQPKPPTVVCKQIGEDCAQFGQRMFLACSGAEGPNPFSTHCKDFGAHMMVACLRQQIPDCKETEGGGG